MSGLKLFHRLFIMILLVPLMSLGLSVPSLAQKPGTEKSIYSPIVRVEADKGFIMVTTGSGILWVQASEAAKPHLSELPVGGLIDIVIEIRGKPTPPLLKSWKLASGESSCKHFDGKACR